MRVGIIVPTHKDKVGKWKKILLEKFVPSTRHLRGLKDFEILINFQDFTALEAMKIAARIQERSGLPVLHTNKSYSKPVSMSKIREEISNIKEMDCYLIVDDDFTFGSNTVQKFTTAKEYLEQNPRCGFLMIKGVRKTQHLGNAITPICNDRWWTNRGTLFRKLPNTSYNLADCSTHHHRGGFEEIFYVWTRLELGYHGAVLYNSNTYHRISISSERWDEKMTKLQKGLLPIKVIGRYPIVEDVHNPSVGAEHLQFLRERFKVDNPKWPFEQQPQIPKYVQEQYLKNGGDEKILRNTKLNSDEKTNSN